MEVGWKTKKLPAHPECSIKIFHDNAMQIHQGHGPYYDRWLAGVLRAFGDKMPGTGVSPENTDPPVDDA
jgi:hypothetical protein